MERAYRKRIAVLITGVALLACAITARLVWLQLVDCERWRERAANQHQRRIEVHPPRGLILDREGRELAVSLETESLFAHPSRVEEPRRAAELLAPVLRQSSASTLAKLVSDKPFVYLGRFMEPEEARRVRELGLPLGDNEPFGFLPESKRYYPRGELGVHVVGFATIDGVGVEGIEQKFDSELRGDPRIYLVTQDGLNRGLRRLVTNQRRAPVDIVLTLDVAIQHIVERELDRAMTETRAESASVVVLEPDSGQILALANRPTVDPARYGQSKPANRLNRALVHQYEPGSTFKIVPMAAALDQGVIRPGELIDCRNGVVRLGDRIIHDASSHGLLSASQVMQKSSNIGMIEIVRRLPPATLRDSIEHFGFGSRLGLELPGEASGRLRPEAEWNAYSYASLAFGHEIAVTTVQMASAFATIANDGIHVPPRIVLGKRDAVGHLLRAPAPQARRVISAGSTRQVSAMLEAVIAQGTGKRARVGGYRIAGKSGTAQRLVDGRYSDSEFVASFGGFGPVAAPRLVVLVVLDAPRGREHQGGEVAAPVFRRIMADALTYLRVPADEELQLVVPPRASWIARDEPDPTRRHPRSDPPGQVPDLDGLSLRDAIRRLAARGYQPRIEGRGLVVTQDPPPGTPLDRGAICRATLAEPEPARTAVVDEPARPVLAARSSR